LLRSKNIEFEEIDVTNNPGLRQEMERLSGRKTVPQVFIDGKALGGFDDINYLDRTGELDRLLEKPLGGE
jgi:glutaredoxin 3